MTWPLRARPGALERAARAGLLVLDIDGVLLDPTPSYYAAAKEVAADAAARVLKRPVPQGISDADIAAFKGAGGWNDDFELACGCAWALVASEVLPSHPSVLEIARGAAGGLDRLILSLTPQLEADVLSAVRIQCETRLIRDRCAARYAGRSGAMQLYRIDPALHPDAPEHGLWSLEPLLASPPLLHASGFDLALFTGRTPGEAAIAVDRYALEIPQNRRIQDDGVTPRKPSPDGLVRLARDVRPRALFLIGDAIDDQNAALAYRALADREGLCPIVFARALGVSATSDQIEAAWSAGADVVTPGLDELLRALPPRDRRDEL